MGEMRNAYNILNRKPEGKRPRGCPRPRWENNIRMNIVDWMHLIQDRDKWRAPVNTVMNL
jgi:hypothetical protein